MTCHDEASNQQALNEFQQHLNLAYSSRNLYNSCIDNAKEGKSLHLIFDFAEQLMIPSTSRQVGPMYFKVGRKIQLFGICNTAIPLQSNYLIDECQTIGPDGKKSHGPINVISMLHHYLGLTNHDNLVLHADNCGSQNKNESVLAYLSWRVMNKLNKSITLHFMPTGHTRSLVDGCFGLVKMKYRRADCYTFHHVVDAVNESAVCNNAVVYPSWAWYNWDEYLPKYFRKLENISKVSFIQFFENGSISSDLHDNYRLVKEHVNVSLSLPDVMEPPGLSEQRRSYLSTAVATLVPEQYQASTSAPL